TVLRGRSRSVVPLSPRPLRIAVASVHSIPRTRTIAPSAGTTMLRGPSHSAVRARQPPRRTGGGSDRLILPPEARPRVAEPAAMAAIGTALHQVPARRAAIRIVLAADHHGRNSICASRSCTVRRPAAATRGEVIAVPAMADHVAPRPVTHGRAT